VWLRCALRRGNCGRPLTSTAVPPGVGVEAQFAEAYALIAWAERAVDGLPAEPATEPTAELTEQERREAEEALALVQGRTGRVTRQATSRERAGAVYDSVRRAVGECDEHEPHLRTAP